MNIQKNNNKNKELEITVELSVEEMKPYITQACEKISKDMKVEGFRPGHIPYDILKQRISEMAILQEAANIAINKTVGNALKDNIKDPSSSKDEIEASEKVIGQPQVRLTKVAANNPMEYKINISLMPEIKLGKYRDLKISLEKVEVGDTEVDRVLKDLQNMRAKEKLVNREIRDGDKVIVNIQMFLDKVPVEGGQSKDTGVIIGADYIVPGFDKNLIGAKKGEVREFKLEYPKDHYQKNLAGKLVEFKVEIKDVYERELPEVNNEFAKVLGLNSLDALKEQLRKNIQNEKKQRAEQKAIVEIFETILKNTTFSHIPETMVNSEAHNMIHELKQNVEQQGGKFEDYLTHIKKSAEELEKELKPEAEKRVKTSLAISQIVKMEDIKVSDEEVQKEMEARMDMYKNNPELNKKAGTDEHKNFVHYNMLNQKVIKELKRWNLV